MFGTLRLTNKHQVKFEKFYQYEDVLIEARYVAEILELEIRCL